jgi:hypothetical protein
VVGNQSTKQVVVAMHTHASNRIGAEALPIKILSINMRRVTAFCESAIGNEGLSLLSQNNNSNAKLSRLLHNQLDRSVLKMVGDIQPSNTQVVNPTGQAGAPCHPQTCRFNGSHCD